MASVNSIAIQITVVDPPRLVAKLVNKGLRKISAPDAVDSKVSTSVKM